jgi:riboflavin-specific deaminase-like protein
MTTNKKTRANSASRLPSLTVKFAQSLDGRIATASGDSQWISSAASLRLAHKLRNEHDAIMVGIGTVLKDNPRLTVRHVAGRDPLRVIVDSRLRIPLSARVLEGEAASHTLIVTTRLADRKRAREIERLGAEVLRLPVEAGQSNVSLAALLRELARKGIESVLVEGGAGIITSLLDWRLVDRMVIVIAPKIIGKGIEAVGELAIAQLSDAITFSNFKTRRLGPDIVFDGWLRKGSEK